MENAIEVSGGSITSVGEDTLMKVAEQAERRIEAVKKIKQAALMVTNENDWVSQAGKPYLMASGAEKIARLFEISWTISEPMIEEEEDGHFTYSYKGCFSMAGATIEVIGSRSSKDGFFNKYSYPEGKKTLLPPSSIDKGDVKKSALTNLLGNGITRLLGIRNLSWKDLKAFAGVDEKEIAGVNYKKSNASQPRSGGGGGNVTENQLKMLEVRIAKSADKNNCLNELLGEFQVKALKDLSKAKMNEVLKFIDEYKSLAGDEDA